MNVKDLVKLRELNKVEALWCQAQQEDVQLLIDLMENVSESALQTTLSPMGYDMLKLSKKHFVKTLMEISERYRCVIPEKV